MCLNYQRVVLIAYQRQRNQKQNQNKINIINDNVYFISMFKDNSKTPFKVINAKIVNALTAVKTPTGHSTGLTERMLNITSPSTLRKQSSQHKIVSIDLKPSRKQSQQFNPNKLKKIVKVRRKTQSVDKALSKQQQKSTINVCNSQKRLQKTESASTIKTKLKCFDEVNSCDLGFEMAGSSRSNEKNWDQIVQMKKQQLYSQLYKMDKKIFAFQRDIDDMPNKRAMMEMIKRKTCATNVSKQNNVISPIEIHKNIYKMGKNRIS